MNERHFARRIAETLNFSLRNIEQDKLERLRAARHRALEAASEPRYALGLAWLGSLGGGHGSFSHAQFWLPIAALLLVLFGTAAWNYSQRNEVEDIDAALLAGDLPIPAYIDHGFDAWLEHSWQL